MAAVCLVSLGCSKNLVDSEVMAGHLGRAGISLVTDPQESDIVIVNTCGFVEDARAESVDTIRRYAEMKFRGDLRGLVVAGCMVELHRRRLEHELPDVDAFLPLSDYSGVPSIVDALLGPDRSDVCPGGAAKQADTDLGRALLTTRHTAYLRLGEGCNHVCAFCAIPKIRGKLKSKPIEVLVEEAEALVELGVVELTLIAEDSTDYAKDLGHGYGLAELLTALGGVDGLRWVRVMYAHPATIDDRLIDTMASVPNVLPYIDMPVQHGDAGVLRAMRRGTSPQRIRDVVGRLRLAMPDVTLRTTILVGFPGEDEQAFASLMDFLEELRFERVGCFAWSPEEVTEAAALAGRVPPEAADERRGRVMRLARRHMEEHNRARVGTTVDVLVDAAAADRAVGRTVADAPEIDGQVLLTGAGLEPGHFVAADVTGVEGYDLVATLRSRP